MTDTINSQAPGFKPVDKAPKLARYWGIGTALYGKQAVNREQGLYIRYLCFTVLYIPVLLLGRYLIQAADGGQYVVGRAGVHGLARAWNALFVIAVLVVGGGYSYITYTSSPTYVAQQHFHKGVAALEQGNFSAGLSELFQAYHSDTTVSATARGRLLAMGRPDYLAAQAPADAALVVRELVQIGNQVPALLDTATALFEQYRETQALAAKQLADAIIGLSDNPDTIEQYRRVQYELMSDVVAQHPDNPGYAIELAQLDELYNRCERCEALLVPHQSQLGNGEGARILGQIYAANGDVEGAYQLLAPYTELGLTRYHALSAEYDEVTDAVWNEMIEFLNSSRAPQSFITRYDAAQSEEEQNQLLNEFYIERLQGSRRFQDVKQRYEASTAIVPVALDLGIVTLNRAIAMTDAAVRQQQLAAAEATFLAVRGEAGDSDDYQWYLGQVYYWLGKETQGQELFDNLLAKYDRSPSVLYSLSDILRDLGASGIARDLAMEAYEKSTDPAEKQNLASHLALLADDLDERLVWTEKADLTNPYTKANLFTLRAYKAEEADKKPEALALFNQAIAAYATIPEDASVHNNIALVYMAKYRVGKDEDDYNQALASLDQAVTMAPDSSIILSNSADYHLNKVYRDTVAPHMNLQKMDVGVDRRLLYFLYENDEGKKALLGRMLDHPSMQKTLSYTNKALLLAPKDSQLLARSYALYSFLRKDTEVELLVARTAPLGFDLRAAEEQMAKYRAGDEDAERMADYRENIASLQQTLAQLNPQREVAEIAVLTSYIIANQIGLTEFGASVDLDDLARRARENYQRFPSVQAATDYQNVLWLRVVDTARARSQQFATFYDTYHRYYDMQDLLTLAVHEVDGLPAIIKSSADFKTLTDFIRADVDRFPQSANVTEWYLLTQLGNDLAKPLQTIITNNTTHPLAVALSSKISANHETNAVLQYFTHSALGEKDQAETVLTDAANRKLKLPGSLLALAAPPDP